MSIDGLKLDVNSQLTVEVRAGVAGSQSQNVTIEEQVTVLFRQWRGSIVKYLVAVFGKASAVDPDDITQEAFLQLHRMMQKGQAIENPRAYLFRIAHNTALARVKTAQFIAPLDDLAWDELCRTTPDLSDSPEQVTQRLEDLGRVYEAIKRLTFKERQCLYLRLEGLRYREIGEVLGLSEASTGTHLRRAIQKLMPPSDGENDVVN